jgi:hypothetical protein
MQASIIGQYTASLSDWTAALAAIHWPNSESGDKILPGSGISLRPYVRATLDGVANVSAALPLYNLSSHPHPSLVAPGALPSRGDEPLLGKEPAPKPGVGRSMVPTDATPVFVQVEFLK